MEKITIEETYGNALFTAAKDVNKIDLILKESQELIELFHSEPKFYAFITTPVISARSKKEVVKTVLSGKICDELLNMLFVMIDKGRARHFEKIVRQYKNLINESDGFSFGEIYSVIPLKNEQINIFEEKTGTLLRKKVKLENKTDATILGGVRIYIDGKVIDATIRKRLNDLSESMR